jgi:Tfp pilus assembly protein PilO
MSKNSHSNLISGIIIIVLILGFTFIISPLQKQIAENKESLQKIETELATKKADLDNLTTLNTELPQNDLSRKALSAKAPEGLNQSELINTLNSIATKNGITLHSINFDLQGENQELKNVKTVNISASFTGLYSDLVKFLTGLESSNRAFLVKSINLQRNDNTTNSSITFNLSLEAYYQ